MGFLLLGGLIGPLIKGYLIPLKPGPLKIIIGKGALILPINWGLKKFFLETFE